MASSRMFPSRLGSCLLGDSAPACSVLWRYAEQRYAEKSLSGSSATSHTEGLFVCSVKEKEDFLKSRSSETLAEGEVLRRIFEL